ncbi:MAG: oxidoreductase, partial [Pseudomonadota bacterium]
MKTNPAFPHLLSEVRLGDTVIKNRIVSTGHHTYIADRHPNDELIAYHRARAKGGAGLIVSEIVAVHSSAAFSPMLLNALSDDVIPHYSRLVDCCHAESCAVLAQLFHPGREIINNPEGFAPIAHAPSAVPNERFHIMPKPMSAQLIKEIISGFGMAASRMERAGFDGVEIVASHGYLPAQFLNPVTNLRDDQYGGDFARRLNFLLEVISQVRECAPSLTLGLRLSADEMDPMGMDSVAMAQVCAALDP